MEPNYRLPGWYWFLMGGLAWYYGERIIKSVVANELFERGVGVPVWMPPPEVKEGKDDKANG